jgi:hypothetical protein
MDTKVSRIRGKALDSALGEKNYVFLRAYAVASIEPIGHTHYHFVFHTHTHIRYSMKHNIYENVYIRITIFLLNLPFIT